MHTQTHAVEHAHPGFPTYIKIALILTAITVVEVAVYYVDAVRPALVPVLLTLSIVKFALVVGYFMHLKFDHRLLTGLFVFGLAIALAVFLGLGALFHNAGNTVMEGGSSSTQAAPTGGGH
jgi:cytochrome c oxidase subunit IV